MSNPLSKSIEHVIPAYIVLVTMLFYFFQRYDSGNSINIFISYGSSIAVLYIFYFFSKHIKINNRKSKKYALFFDLSFFPLSLSIFLIAFINSGKIINPLLGKISTGFIIVTFIYIIVIPLVLTTLIVNEYIKRKMISKKSKIKNENILFKRFTSGLDTKSRLWSLIWFSLSLLALIFISQIGLISGNTAMISIYALSAIALLKMLFSTSISRQFSIDDKSLTAMNYFLASICIGEALFLLSYFGFMNNFNITNVYLKFLDSINSQGLLILLPVLFSFIGVVFLVFHLAKKNSDIEEIYGKLSYMHLIILILIFVSFWLFVMYALKGFFSVRTVVLIKDVLIVLILLNLRRDYLIKSRRIVSDCIRLNKKNKSLKNLRNGSYVHLKGIFSKTKIQTQNVKFWRSEFTEKMIFYEISIGGKRYDVYIGKGSKKIISEFIDELDHGCDAEIWGKLIKLKINDDNFNIIYPLRVYNLNQAN